MKTAASAAVWWEAGRCRLAAALLDLLLALFFFRLGLLAFLGFSLVLLSLLTLLQGGLLRFFLRRLGFLLLSECRSRGEGERADDQRSKKSFHFEIVAIDSIRQV